LFVPADVTIAITSTADAAAQEDAAGDAQAGGSLRTSTRPTLNDDIIRHICMSI
jgi:hypothetical protein